MVHFDKQTRSVLNDIRRSGYDGITWHDLQLRNGARIANVLLLRDLTVEGYTVTHDASGHEIALQTNDDRCDLDFRSFITPKGNELLERNTFDFWKFVIPLLVSVLALIVSVLSLLKDR